MAQGCLKCLKYTMCLVNLLCFLCGTAVFGFGVFLMMNSKVSSLIPTLSSLSLANTLFITGIIITCVSFLGFLGALKENRCLLITFFILLFMLMVVELTAACLLLVYEKEVKNSWQGCYDKLKAWFEENFLSTGVGVIVLCVIEVLGMCFSMTLFCHISRSGLGYKL
ncbi:leukocyte surface antigen CD53-like [Aplochiton taeniatus]